jgi:diguanylate cyclase (GGDEF)-like protein
MHLPDVDTLRLCSILASSAFGLVFVTLWLRSRADRHFGLWGMSSLLYGAVIQGYWMTPAGSTLVILALYALLGVTNVLCVAGARVLDGAPAFRAWMVLPIAGTALGHGLPLGLAALGIVTPDGIWQTVGDALGLAVSMSLCGAVLGFGPGAARYSGRRMAGMAMLAYVPAYVLSIVFALWSLPGSAWVALLAMLSDQVLLGVLNLGLLAIPVEQVQRQLRDAALRDPLTGTWNRAGLDRMAPRFVTPGAAAIALDVDHFKAINDRFGHAAGDEVLAAIGHEARALAGPAGCEVARIGGDEFVVLMPPGRGARSFAAELQGRLGAMGEATTGWSVSMGIGDVLGGDTSLIGAIRRADESLYEAKARGRARIAA